MIRHAVTLITCLATLAFTSAATGAAGIKRDTQTAPTNIPVDSAIDGGDPSVMNDVGMFYDDVGNNTNEALKWYLKAALAGSKPARLNLAVALFVGRGIPQDRALALFWMRLAEIDGPVLSEGNLVHPTLLNKMGETERQRGIELFEKYSASQTIPPEAIPTLPLPTK